jgi:arsenate reductase (thioredoxin)
MKKIMFLCTGNSCRSQMAEGFAKALGKGLLEVHSAGLSPQRVNPRAVAVMKEAGNDISGQISKSIDEELLSKMDIIITLCGNAAESCPLTPPGIKRIHWPLEDPAKATGTEEEILNEFRKVRDGIKRRIEAFINDLKGN